MTTIHILRHGQALHKYSYSISPFTKADKSSIERGYPHRDPPLTDLGTRQARNVQQTIKIQPDLIIVSPMTRTIQTMYIVFRYLLHSNRAKIQVWPDLREAHDATCNKGISRKDLADKFPNLDLSACPEEWDFPVHTPDDATVRAERVRRRLKEIARVGGYKNIMLVTHRGFAAFLVQGERFSVCGKIINTSWDSG
ncbi:phosphoglycerate mutase [Fusarium beomiforme]|uniref:Phosphoglycerate mutase n=1 Tax=Fusarium beomiforme TaxID=44412 RepID=A0A9P5ARI8_9HYPO|nr:phosphoglycerate mutase [Fusarium beomiforme]